MYAHLPFQYPGYMPQMHQDPMYPLNVGAIPEQPARQQARPAGLSRLSSRRVHLDRC